MEKKFSKAFIALLFAIVVFLIGIVLPVLYLNYKQ